MKVKVNGAVISVPEFCEKYGLNLASFKRWQYRNPEKKQREMLVKLLIEFVEE